MRKLTNRKIVEQAESALYVKGRLLITATSCQTIEIPKVWEEPGETTIRTTSRQRTGGAMKKKDR